MSGNAFNLENLYTLFWAVLLIMALVVGGAIVENMDRVRGSMAHAARVIYRKRAFRYRVHK